MNFVSTADTALNAVQELIYEQTQWQILIDGNPVKRIVSFRLSQVFNAHNRFELRIHHTELEEPRTYRIDNIRTLPGKTLTATMGSTVQDDRVQFTGIITQVSLTHAKGLNGDLIIEGYSPTILLEGGKHIASFYKQNLQNIAKAITDPLAGKLEVTIAPKYQQQLTYITQYKETAFAFLNRLCSWLGEWYYYDGRKLCLGKPSSLPQQKLYFGKHLDNYKMEVKVAPMNFTQFDYDSHIDKVVQYRPERQVDGLNYYGDLSLDLSEQVFPQPTKETTLQASEDAGLYMQMVQVKKAALAGENFQLSATCKSPYLTLGTRLTLCFGEEELGQYLVTEVEHLLENGNKYHCSFKAIAGDTLIIPAPILAAPSAEPQLAVVKKNDDPQGQGRVRVQFQWQEGDTMSDWIRVMSPDAGGSGEKVKQNRGFVFIPEVNDLVVVSFRQNNPDDPFVLGSLHHGKVAGGGGKGNKTKSLTTRSGSRVTLDDEKGSVTVSDPSGNRVVLHGNGSMTIHAPKQLNLVSEQINLQAEKQINVQAKTELTISSEGSLRVEVKEDATVTLEKALKTTALEVETTIENGMKLQATDVAVNGSGKVHITGSDTQVV